MLNRDAPRPTMKRQIKLFLGLTGFNRRFIPNFLSVDKRNSIKDWRNHHEKAFQTLNKRLTSSPFLRVPGFSKVIRSPDGCNRYWTRSCVASRFEGDGCLPKLYASKKLLPRER